MVEGLTDGAFEKGDITPMEAVDLLQDYFMNKRGERMRAIAEKRHAADSIRLMGGDSTKVEYPVADPEMFESEKERADISYALGLNTGSGLSEIEVPLQTYWIGKAIKDVQEGNAQMDERTAGMFWNNYMMIVVPAQNKEKSEQWLASIEKKSGVQKTESGLLYKVEKEGDMSMRATDDRDVVKVHYKGYEIERQGIRRLAFRRHAQDAPGDHEEADARGLRQGRAHRVPAEPRHQGLDRGYEAGRQGR